MAKPLSGKEIIEAAQKGIEVLYVYKSYNAFEKDRDVSLRIVPQFRNHGTDIELDEDETGFYWKVSELKEIDSLSFDLDNGTEAVYAADVPTEREQLKEKLAKFLHEEVWAHWMRYLLTEKAQYMSEDESFAYGQYLIEREDADRWERQMNTTYDNLPEEEKLSDQELAEKLITLLKEEQ